MNSGKEKPTCNLYTAVPSEFFKFRFQCVLVLHSVDSLECVINRISNVWKQKYSLMLYIFIKIPVRKLCFTNQNVKRDQRNEHLKICVYKNRLDRVMVVQNVNI